jgi:hypothetical protein
MDEVRHRLAEAIAITRDQEWARSDHINAATVLRRDGSKPLRDLLSQGNQIKLRLAERDLTRL